jgi:hypothetical protein
MNCKVIEHKGQLYIQGEPQNHWREPIRYWLAWPTGISTSNYGYLVGQKARPMFPGLYQTESGIRIELENGPETKSSPEASHEEPIKRPRGKTEYRNGAWV